MTTYCEECREQTEYIATQETMESTLKGKKYQYIGTEAKCAQCGAPVFVHQLCDDNLKALYDVYRKENGLVPLDIVRAIPKTYNIAKRSLSDLLGWGTLTFSRFYDGDIPSRQYSDVLLRIYRDPQYFAELLEENKDRLSPKAYEKARSAVSNLLSSHEPTESNINNIVHYLLNRCEDITPLALQKALYYIQGFYFSFYDSFLFSEDCQAWTHGPVYADIYFRYRDYRFDPIEKVPYFDASILSSGEKAVCDSVITNLCCYSGRILERFTHSESPWLIARGDLPDYAVSNRIIEKSTIGSYFKAVKAKYNMVNPDDISEYAQDMFRKIRLS